MSIEILDDRLIDLVDEGARYAILAEGLLSSEGPIWIAEDDCLLFSDIQHNRRCRWDERDGLRVVAEPTSKANGMTRDAEGRLIVCEHIAHSIVRMDPDGSGAGREVLCSHYGGKELNSPNDVIVASDGSIYFTDPPGGRMAQWGEERDPELDYNGVYRWTAGEELRLVDTFTFPNGLCLSPDESIFYVNDSTEGRIFALDLSEDGAVSSRRVFAEGVGPPERGTVDGMQCDEHGNVWVTGPNAIWVYTPEGKRLGGLPIPDDDRALNLHWGGSTWNWLFITGTKRLYRYDVKARPRREPFMRS
jgi:gluconolactonase